MKKRLLHFCFTCVLAISCHSFGSDLDKLYPKQLAEAKSLYLLAQQYFRGPGSLPPGEMLTPEMVKDPVRLDASYRLRRLLALAIDAQQDISALEEFAVSKKDNWYVINFKQNPQ